MAILTPSNTIAEFERNGFAIIRGQFSASQILQLTTAIESCRESHISALSAGFRNLLGHCPGVRQFTDIRKLREIVVGLQGELSCYRSSECFALAACRSCLHLFDPC